MKKRQDKGCVDAGMGEWLVAADWNLKMAEAVPKGNLYLLRHQEVVAKSRLSRPDVAARFPARPEGWS